MSRRQTSESRTNLRPRVRLGRQRRRERTTASLSLLPLFPSPRVNLPLPLLFVISPLYEQTNGRLYKGFPSVPSAEPSFILDRVSTAHAIGWVTSTSANFKSDPLHMPNPVALSYASSASQSPIVSIETGTTTSSVTSVHK